MTGLSILELVRVTEATDARGALDNARDLARACGELGLPPLLGGRASQHAGHRQRGDLGRASPISPPGRSASASARAASCCPITRRYVIAEQFGTLERLFPGRIDLGLGRAPGTDQLTAARAAPHARQLPSSFRRTSWSCRPISRRPLPGQRIQAVPAAGTEVPLWILGLEHFRRAAGRRARACPTRSPRISRPIC